jgi:hypothetical protein
LAQGLPQLLAVRSPHATGLASSLSGCISLIGQRCLFRHRRHCGSFAHVLPRHCVLPGSNAPFVPPFSVFRLAVVHSRKPPESSAPCWCAVTTVYPLGNCDSPKGRNRPCATSLDSKRLLIASHRAGSFRVTDGARTLSEEPVNPASSASTFVALSRDQTNQPGSIFPRSPGFIFETLVKLSFQFAISFFQ